MPKIILLPAIIISVIWTSCKSADKKIILPDLRPDFQQLLTQKDPSLILDSFYFIRIDTMNEKEALIHQRFPFYNIMERLNGQLERKQMDSETTDYLENEEAYVRKEIDSLDRLITVADSITPIGYRAFYKTTISKKDKFVISDTVAYAISLKMTASDWDRNLEKNIDSLSVGKRLHNGQNR
jgi:hypothetical protein